MLSWFSHYSVLSKFRRKSIATKPGIILQSISLAQEVAQKEGLKDGEMGWVLENNLAMNKPILKMGGKPYKTYRIFESGYFGNE